MTHPIQHIIDVIENEPDESTLLAEKSLKEFIRQAWHIVEPANEFKSNWHIDATCDHLEALYHLEIRKLLINLPPRGMKSLQANVFFPAWIWTDRPSYRTLTASYTGSLTIRDNLKFRSIIQSKWYQKNWGKKFQLAGDQNTKIKIENDKTGYKIATSVGGTAIGDGGDLRIVDDAHNIQNVESDLIREATIEWFRKVWPSRGMTPKTDIQLVIMQRSHHKDVSGYILAKSKGYEYLCLPMEFEPSRKCFTSIGFEDPRKKEDELLWPDRFDKEFIDDMKTELGSNGYAGQYQQRPSAKEGSIIKRGYWKFYDELPPVDDWELMAHSWDTAYEENKTSDYWAMIGGVKTNTRLYIIPEGYFMQKMETPEGEQKIRFIYRRDNPGVVLIEKKASGQSILQSIKRDSDIPLKAIEVHRDKVARANTAAPKIEAGLVLLPNPEVFPEASWVDNFIEHCASFPKGENDDDIDAATQLINYFWGQPIASIISFDDEEEEDYEEDEDFEML